MQPFKMPDFYVPWPARRNPHLDAARAHTKGWAQQVGILGAPHQDGSNIWSERDFDTHDYALLCAYIHPETPIPELNLMADWNVWAFYVDDYFLHTYRHPKDRAAAKKYLDRVLVFMPVDLSPLPTPTNPMERGLADLWLRTAPSKSQAWRKRIFESTRTLLDAFLWELDNKNQRRISNPIEYVEMRRQVGAALWSADLVEHAMFIEIPERIANTRPIRVLRETFADGVHLRNDIFSYQREVLKQGELTNAVHVFELFLNVDTQLAVNLTNDLLTSRLEQFEHTASTELEQLFEEYYLDAQEQASVLTYVRGLQDWQSGAHEWHIQTSRYLSHLLGQTAVTSGFTPSLAGLGTSATRIVSKIPNLKGFRTYKHNPYQKVGPTPLPNFYMPFKATINPHLETARQYSKIWSYQMGMFEPVLSRPGIIVRDERSFDTTDVAFFTALAQPTAAADELNQYACWMAWGTYADDYFTEVYGHIHDMEGAKSFHSRLSEFMPLSSTICTPSPHNPVERGLADLWAHAIQTLSLDERPLFRSLIENLIGSWLWELSNRIQNRIPDPIDYVEMRRKTSAADFVLIFVRFIQNKGFPPEIYQTLTLQELEHIAMDYAGLNNDIVSYQKEIEFEGDTNNGVLVIQNLMGCDRMQAVEIVNNLTTSRIKQFEHIVKSELPLLFENFGLDVVARKQVLNYVAKLQLFIYASLQWHTKAGCYKEVELKRRSNKFFIENSSGLGTSAMRVLDAIRPVTRLATSLPIQPDPMPQGTKPFATSHLNLSFIKSKEPAQAR